MKINIEDDTIDLDFFMLLHWSSLLVCKRFFDSEQVRWHFMA